MRGAGSETRGPWAMPEEYRTPSRKETGGSRLGTQEPWEVPRPLSKGRGGWGRRLESSRSAGGRGVGDAPEGGPADPLAVCMQKAERRREGLGSRQVLRVLRVLPLTGILGGPGGTEVGR